MQKNFDFAVIFKASASSETWNMFDTDLVRVGQSKVCAGLGVFAWKNIEKRTLVTRYHGRVCPSQDEAASLDPTLRYNMEYGKEGEILVGESDIDECEGKGVAQLVNDAVSVALHGRYNNCCFVDSGGEVWLRSLRAITRGEELLSGYGIEYWQSEIVRAPSLYTNRFELEIIRNTLLISRLREKYGIETMYCSGWSIARKIGFACGPRFKCPSGVVHETSGYVDLLKVRPSKNGKHEMDFVCDVCAFEEIKTFTMPILRKLRYARARTKLAPRN